LWQHARGGNRGGAHVGRPGEKGERPGPWGIVSFQDYSRIFFIFDLNWFGQKIDVTCLKILK
jgi:hypothetical protein